MEARAGTIVVGVDASQSAQRALAWAAAQARAGHRSVTLAHGISAVTPAYLDAAAVFPKEARDALHEAGQRILDEARAEVQRRAPGVEVHEVIRFEDPRELLLELSRDAALVVLGSRGRGQLRSLLLGSVGVALVKHAHCPVVVHRPGNPGTVRQGVLVGTDASEESSTVLEFAYREASLLDLPLTVVHCVWDTSAVAMATYAGSLPGVDIESERLGLAESMAGMAEKYPDVTVSTQMVRGLPQQVLVELSDRMNLTVVGAHQAGPMTRMLVGSVSVAVVEHAGSPVAVVPLSSSS